MAEIQLETPPPDATASTSAVEPKRTWRQWFRNLSLSTKLFILCVPSPSLHDTAYSDVSCFFAINFAIALAFIVLGKSRINAFFNDLGTKLREMGPVGAIFPCLAVSE